MTLFMETTKISPERSVAQIQSTLSKYGAVQVLTEYNNGQVESVSFKMSIQSQLVPFRLPCRWEAVQKQIETKRKRFTSKGEHPELQARRVAWRQILKWVEAQCALISTGMVATEEIFMPYMQMKDGNTLFEIFRNNQMRLEYKK